ncbi:adenylate/guanylate cyclase domain-containing protein [Geodermatophilus sp. SYSU D00766]
MATGDVVGQGALPDAALSGARPRRWWSGTPRGRPLWAWAVAATTLVLLGWPPGRRPSWDVVTVSHVLSVLVCLVAGWRLLTHPVQRPNGALMLALALTSCAEGSLQDVATGPWEVLSYLLEPLVALPFAVLMLRWPRQRLQTRAERWALLYAAATLPLLRVLNIVTWDPRWIGYTGPGWWPTLVHDQALADSVFRIEMVNWLVLTTLFLVLLALRVRRAATVERRALVPVVVAGLAFSGHVATTALVWIVDLDHATPAVLVSANLAFMAIPLGVLLSLGVQRVQRALAVEALLQPRRLPDPESVRTALARALGDRDLVLTLWSPERQAFLTPDGREVAGAAPSRHRVDLATADGAPLASLGIDPRLTDETDLVETVTRAAGLALDNARLQAELRARQREVDESTTRLLQAGDVERSLSRLVPGGLAERLRTDPSALTRTDRLTVTVLMSDVRGYSTLAERAEPAELAEQLNDHRREMNRVVLAEGGTVVQYVGDAVLAVFGAPDPQPDHAVRGLRAALGMHAAQERLDRSWAARDRRPFGLGIGICTGEVAAAFLGSEERLEYTVVGDTVNLAARLCDLARPAGSTVASATTVAGAVGPWSATALPPLRVKGRVATVSAYRVDDAARTPTRSPQSA